MKVKTEWSFSVPGISDTPRSLFVDENRKVWDAEDAAELCAEQYFYESDGWEDDWPLQFVVVRDGSEPQRWEIEREDVPQFNARPCGRAADQHSAAGGE